MQTINATTLKFLKLLAQNNNKPWFDAHRSEYEIAKLNFVEFIGDLIPKVSAFDPRLAGLEAKKTVFRINRDVRFSKDKSPYKNNFGATLSAGAKNMQTAGYYIQIQPGNKSFVGAGSYMPIPEHLAKIRQEIDYNLKDFNKILTTTSFKKQFDTLDVMEKLKTAPKGYDPSNPAIELLKNKSFIVSCQFSDKEVVAPDFLKNLTQSLKASYPLVKFLRDAIES